MEIRIDSFAAAFTGRTISAADNASSMELLLDRMEHADRSGWIFFGIGKHHRVDFPDAPPTIILSAAAAAQKVSV